MFVFSFIPLHWDGAGYWNPFLWKAKTYLSSRADTIVTDNLAMKEDGATVAMVLAYFS